MKTQVLSSQERKTAQWGAELAPNVSSDSLPSLGNAQKWRVFQPLLALLLGIGLARPALPAPDRWGVIVSARLDTRFGDLITALAKSAHAELVPLESPDEAKSQHVSTLIEVADAEGGPELFAAALKREAGPAGAKLTPELAAQGYLIDIAYNGHARPSRLRVTASTPEGFHNALLRVPDLLHIARASLTQLLPRPQSLRVEKTGKAAMLADFPSFPVRGIVEGFYGPPWSQQDRLDILSFEGRHAMNVYYYAPKDDPYHRKLWAEPYPPDQMQHLGELAAAARANFVDFCFAISPGLSMTYSSDADFGKLTSKLDSVAKLGVSCFALFVDDVPEELQNPADQARYKSLGEAHVDVTNRLYNYLAAQSPKNRLTVTPTTYTNDWGSRDYIQTLGAGVDSHVDLVWTGVKVVSPTITAAQAREWGAYLRRPPLVWDNFPVNDGIPWRPCLGPMRGRDTELPGVVRGLVSNPMNQAHASMLPLQTIADYLWNSAAYSPERAEQKALADQYGQDGGRRLGTYLETYSDYWWQDNLFKPLYTETHKPIAVGRMKARLKALEASIEPLEPLGCEERFVKLVPELTPFPAKTRKRLSQVEADAAFRHLPNGSLQWRAEYDVLEARRVTSAPVLDGDFSKWAEARVYRLDQPSQLRSDPKLWKGPDQFSLRVALAWDQSYFYIGVDAADPDLYQRFTGRDITKGDVFRVTLDAAYRQDLTRKSFSGDEYLLFFSPGNFAGAAPAVYSEEEYLPPRTHPRDYASEIKTAWKKTAQGFSGDIAIPVGYFDGAFRPGYEIGLDFGARKAIPPPTGTVPGDDEPQYISFDSKADRLFSSSFRNASTYQRLVLH